MEHITLGQLTDWIQFILVLFGSIGSILFGMKKIFNKQLEPLHNTVKQLDIDQCKNHLARFLAAVESGKKLDNVEIAHAHEVYDPYRTDLNGNSYIHDKWERLMKGRD